MVSELPTEIVELVIDILSSDRSGKSRTSDLRACSLASRKWLPRSQFHLFSTIYVQYTRHLLRLQPILERNATIANYVQTVVADLAIYRDESDYIPQWLRLLPNLRTFLVSPSFASRPKSKRWSQNARTFSSPNVTTVSLVDIGLDEDTFVDFTRLVSCFPNLKRLSTDCWWHGGYISGSTSMEEPPTLTALKVVAEPSVLSFPPEALASDVFRWLQDTPSTASITSLAIYADQEEDMSDSCAFIARCAGLEVLSLRLCHYRWLWINSFNNTESAYWSQNVTLAHNPSLHTLRLERIGYRYLNSLLAVFATSSRQLQEIQIKLRDNTIADPQPAAAIMPGIASLSMLGLRKIIFIVESGVSCVTFYSWLCPSAPGCEVQVVNLRDDPGEPPELSLKVWEQDGLIS